MNPGDKLKLKMRYAWGTANYNAILVEVKDKGLRCDYSTQDGRDVMLLGFFPFWQMLALEVIE